MSIPKVFTFWLPDCDPGLLKSANVLLEIVQGLGSNLKS